MEILQIKETCLYVESLESCKNFYHHKLNLPIISHKKEHHIFFRAGSSVLLCFLAEKSKKQETPPPHYAYGKQHIAFEVAIAQYDSAKAFLSAQGITVSYEHHWPNGRFSAYFEDPEGHVLEIVPTGLWDD